MHCHCVNNKILAAELHGHACFTCLPEFTTTFMNLQYQTLPPQTLLPIMYPCSVTWLLFGFSWTPSCTHSHFKTLPLILCVHAAHAHGLLVWPGFIYVYGFCLSCVDYSVFLTFVCLLDYSVCLASLNWFPTCNVTWPCSHLLSFVLLWK